MVLALSEVLRRMGKLTETKYYYFLKWGGRSDNLHERII